MRSGELDRRMDIQQATDAQVTSGDISSTYENLWTGVPCRVLNEKGSEKFEQDRDTSRTTTQFKIRYRTGLNEKMRIVYQSNNYDITDIQELGRRESIIITAYKKY